MWFWAKTLPSFLIHLFKRLCSKLLDSLCSILSFLKFCFHNIDFNSRQFITFFFNFLLNFLLNGFLLCLISSIISATWRATHDASSIFLPLLSFFLLSLLGFLLFRLSLEIFHLLLDKLIVIHMTFGVTWHIEFGDETWSNELFKIKLHIFICSKSKNKLNYKRWSNWKLI